MQRGTCHVRRQVPERGGRGRGCGDDLQRGGEDARSRCSYRRPGHAIPAVMVATTQESRSTADSGRDVTCTSRSTQDHTRTPLEQRDRRHPVGDKNRTIVVGAHLDSVDAGPGINDDGSGTRPTSRSAEADDEAALKPRNRVRFAFFGRRGGGAGRVDRLRPGARDAGKIGQIEAMLDFDMLASPNFVRFVYDGDGSDATGPPARRIWRDRGAVQRVLRPQGLATCRRRSTGARTTARSSTTAFPPAASSPARRGSRPGAGGRSSAASPGLAYDPCYHQACDTFFNLNPTALDEMSDAVATPWTLARSKSPITQAQAAKVAKAKKARKASRTRTLKYRGSSGFADASPGAVVRGAAQGPPLAVVARYRRLG